ncbi:ulp1 protease family, C-terminal catalytic domain-containing protein [Tanacetum coccineum]
MHVLQLDASGHFTFTITCLPSVCNLIKEKLKIISEEKAKLEDLLRKDNTQFSNDEDVRELYEKCGEVFKETVLLEEEQVHVDDFHPGDDEKVETYCFKCGEVFKETTHAIIEGRIDNDEQWNMFSAEISVQFKHNLVAKSLLEVELTFSLICASGHFYLVVFNTKKQTSMIILDNSDCGETYDSKYKGLVNFWYLCDNQHPKHAAVAKIRARIPKLKWRTTTNHVDYGVFTMIHMESYIGEPAARWDVGLCTELEKHVLLLRRMRAERDPVKNVVHNQEGDAMKNVAQNQKGNAATSK